MITWQELVKCESCEMYKSCKGISWDVFITWVCIGIFVVAFWVWVVFGVIRVIYWLK